MMSSTALPFVHHLILVSGSSTLLLYLASKVRLSKPRSFVLRQARFVTKLWVHSLLRSLHLCAFGFYTELGCLVRGLNHAFLFRMRHSLLGHSHLRRQFLRKPLAEGLHCTAGLTLFSYVCKQWPSRPQGAILPFLQVYHDQFTWFFPASLFLSDPPSLKNDL